MIGRITGVIVLLITYFSITLLRNRNNYRNNYWDGYYDGCYDYAIQKAKNAIGTDDTFTWPETYAETICNIMRNAKKSSE